MRIAATSNGSRFRCALSAGSASGRRPSNSASAASINAGSRISRLIELCAAPDVIASTLGPRFGDRRAQAVVTDLPLQQLVADDPGRGCVQLQLACDGEVGVEF